MKRVTGRQKITFIFDALSGNARTLRRGGRRGWPTFSDIMWSLVKDATRVAVTVQRDPRGSYEVRSPNFWVLTSFALDVYKDGSRVGRVCREVFERIFGPVGEGQRFKVTKRVVLK